MSALPLSDAVRLTKLVALLDSDHEGEAASALAAVKRALGKHGLRLADVFNPPLTATPRAARPRTAGQPAPEDAWREDAARCLRRQWLFTAGECEFLVGVQQAHNPTARQRRWLTNLAKRAGLQP